MRFLTRLLPVLLGVLLLVSAVLWFAGRRGDRGSIEDDLTINRPAPVVFRWLTTDELIRRWVSDVVALDSVNSDSGSTLTNRTVRLEQIISGRRVGLELKFTQVSANQQISLQFRSTDPTGCTGLATFRLIPNSEYTQLTFSSQARFFGAWDEFLEPVWTLSVKRKLHEDLLRLKLEMEAEPPSRGEAR